MGWARVVSCVALAACGHGKNGSDAQSSVASLSFDRLSIGATVVRAPLPLDPPLAASYLVVDAHDPTMLDTIPAMQSATNTWSASIASGTPVIDFTLPDVPAPLERQWSFGRNVYALYGQLEHPDKQPAPTGGMLHATVNLATPYNGADQMQMYIVGTWAQHVFAGAELPTTGGTQISTTLAYDATQFQSLSGRALDAITTDDAVVMLRYAGAHLIASCVAPAFAQTGNDAIAGAMTATPQSSTLDVRITPAMPTDRLSVARPALTASTLMMSWELRAAPGYLYASNSGPLLDSATLTTASPATITDAYGNPFATLGWHELLSWSNYELRTVNVAGTGLPMTLYGALTELAEPMPGLVLDLPAALPLVVSIDQMPLSADNMTVRIDPTKAVDVGFEVDNGTSTYSSVVLYELVPNAPTGATALTYAFRYAASGFGASFQLPPAMFQVGHHYTIRAQTVAGGFPAIASGDLTQRSLPFATAYLDSGVFTVTQ
jgi:hypothetical protein